MLLLFPTKLIKKIHDSSNDKKYYEKFFINRNKKSVKRSKVIAQQPKTLENPSITDIKWTKWIDDIKFPVKVRDIHKIKKKKKEFYHH